MTEKTYRQLAAELAELDVKIEAAWKQERCAVLRDLRERRPGASRRMKWDRTGAARITLSPSRCCTAIQIPAASGAVAATRPRGSRARTEASSL